MFGYGLGDNERDLTAVRVYLPNASAAVQLVLPRRQCDVAWLPVVFGRWRPRCDEFHFQGAERTDFAGLVVITGRQQVEPRPVVDWQLQSSGVLDPGPKVGRARLRCDQHFVAGVAIQQLRLDRVARLVAGLGIQQPDAALQATIDLAPSGLLRTAMSLRVEGADFELDAGVDRGVRIAGGNGVRFNGS